MTVTDTNSSATATASSASEKYDKFSTSSSATEDDRFVNDGTVDIEAGTNDESYNKFLHFVESSDKSKHGISEHSDAGLLVVEHYNNYLSIISFY